MCRVWGACERVPTPQDRAVLFCRVRFTQRIAHESLVETHRYRRDTARVRPKTTRVPKTKWIKRTWPRTSLRGVHLSSCLPPHPPSKKSDRSQNSPRERVRVVPDGLRPDADRCAITHRPTRQRRPITRAVVCACSDGYADYHLQQRPRSQSSEVRRMPPVMAALASFVASLYTETRAFVETTVRQPRPVKRPPSLVILCFVREAVF